MKKQSYCQICSTLTNEDQGERIKVKFTSTLRSEFLFICAHCLKTSKKAKRLKAVSSYYTDEPLYQHYNHGTV